MTTYSTLLKLKLQSDESLAKALDRSVKSVGESVYEIATDTLAGAERTTWFLSCLVPGYSDTCRELAIEDYRWGLSKLELFSRDDAILDMVELYFKRRISQINQPSEKALYLQIAQMIAGIAADEATGTFGEKTLTYYIALAILSTRDFKDAYAKAIIRFSAGVVTLGSYHGKIQKSALAARKIKATHPEYYWDLHRNNLEMLYIFIEEPMSKILYLIDSGSSDKEKIDYLIQDLVRKK